MRSISVPTSSLTPLVPRSVRAILFCHICSILAAHLYAILTFFIRIMKYSLLLVLAHLIFSTKDRQQHKVLILSTLTFLESWLPYLSESTFQLFTIFYLIGFLRSMQTFSSQLPVGKAGYDD